MRTWIWAVALISVVSPAQAGDGGWDYDWSGGYLGVGGGYVTGSQEAYDINSIVSGDEKITGVTVTGYTGTNYQVAGIVFGTEMDVSKGSVAGDFTLPSSKWACDGAAFSCGTEIGWHGSLRGRAGYAINSVLPYVTAGVALGETTSTFEGAGVEISVHGLAYGLVVGAGVEVAVARNLVLRGEALHYQLNDVAEKVGVGEAGAKANFNVVRIGAALKF